MTTAAPDVDDHADLRTSVVLVSLVVVAHLVMAYFVSAINDDLFDLLIDLSGTQLALMIVSVVPTVPLALVVLFWARDRYLGSIACLVVTATGLLPYVAGVVDQRLYEAGDLDALADWIEWSGWLLAGLLPVGAALAWGIARRRGGSWWSGLVVAAVLGVMFRWLDLNPFDSSGLRRPVLAFVYHVVPAVLAGLTCWWLDERDARA